MDIPICCQLPVPSTERIFSLPSLLPQTSSPFHSLSSRGAAKGRSRCREVAFDEYQHTIVRELGVDHDYSRVHMRSGRLEVCSLTATRSTSAGSNGAGEQ